MFVNGIAKPRMTSAGGPQCSVLRYEDRQQPALFGALKVSVTFIPFLLNVLRREINMYLD
jgi:hypothetical protein